MIVKKWLLRNYLTIIMVFVVSLTNTIVIPLLVDNNVNSIIILGFFYWSFLGIGTLTMSIDQEKFIVKIVDTLKEFKTHQKEVFLKNIINKILNKIANNIELRIALGYASVIIAIALIVDILQQ